MEPEGSQSDPISRRPLVYRDPVAKVRVINYLPLDIARSIDRGFVRPI